MKTEINFKPIIRTIIAHAIAIAALTLTLNGYDMIGLATMFVAWKVDS